MIGRRDIFFVPDLLFSILTPLSLPPSSVSLSYFILAVQMHECLGKHSCMISQLPIAILNGTFFRSVKAVNNLKRSAIKQILLLLLLLFPYASLPSTTVPICCSSVYYCSHMLLFRLFLLFPWAMSLCSSVLSDTYVCVDFVFWLVYRRSSRVCYLGLVSWLANLLLFARKHHFAFCMGLLWCTLLYLFWCWSFLCISLQWINK